jgi:hypothetical protein
MPNFLIAGVQRGGTTSLNKMLNQHPDLYIAPKEIHFFDKHYTKGIDWYKKHFAGIKGGLCGEKCPEYIYFEECLQRIKHHRPEMKFIVSLRNPVERAISYYKASRGLRSIHPRSALQEGIHKAQDIVRLKNYSYFHFLHRGFYVDQIRTFLKYFDRSQLYIIIFEKFKQQPAFEVNNVFPFLGLQKRLSLKRIKVNHTHKDVESEVYLREALSAFYTQKNEELFRLLGHEIKEWK